MNSYFANPMPTGHTPPAHRASRSESDWPSAQDYVQAVLRIYLSLPDTPTRARADDRLLALALYRKRVPLWQVECALLYAWARRHFRNPEEPPLEPIRSFRYFRWVLAEVRAEVRQERLDPSYLHYLRTKFADALTEKATRPDWSCT